MTCPGPSAVDPSNPPPANSPYDLNRDEALRDVVDSTPFIVRGRVSEIGSANVRRGTRVHHYGFVIVDVAEYLKGDRAQVMAPYRDKFPLFSIAMISVGDEHAHAVPGPEAGLTRGEERIFFVLLPSQHSSSHGEDGPPAPIRERFGIYNVPVNRILPVEDRGRIEQALRSLTEQEGLAQEHAGTIQQTDRFVQHVRAAFGTRAPQRVELVGSALGVWNFVVAHFQERLGVQLSFGAERSEPLGAHELKVVFAFTARANGRSLPDGELAVGVRTADGIVPWWYVEWPGLRAFHDGVEQIDAARVATFAEQAIGLVFTGEGVEREANVGVRGDGLRVIMADVRSGRFHSESGAAGFLRTVGVDLTPRCLAVFGYRNLGYPEPAAGP